MHRHLPRWTAKVDGLRSGDGRRLQRESPCGVSSGAEGRVARRLWPISCGQRGSCPDVRGLVSREPLLQVVDAFADLGLWGSMPRGARTSERLRLSSGLRFGGPVRPRRDASNAYRSGQRRRGGNIAYAPASFCFSFLRFSRGLTRSNLTVDAGSSVRGRGRPGVRSEVNALVARGHARVTLREPLRVATLARFSASSSPVRAETLQAGGMRSSLYASPRAREDSCGEAIRRNGLTA